MGLFDRRKDATVPTPGAPEAAEPAPGRPAPPAASAEMATTPPQAGPVIHTVAAGESLADLASRYGVAAEEIARQNHVPAPGEIHPGQVFVIRS